MSRTTRMDSRHATLARPNDLRSRGSWLTALSSLALIAFLALPAALAQSAPDVGLPGGVEYVLSVEGIHQYQLDNGLEVILFPDPSKPMTTVNITYKVGSLHEGYGETGMAHLLEHLLFKGTPDHPNVPDELTSHGARANGTTWYDRTNYYETFTATDENLEWALDLEADRMLNSFVAKEDLDSEMSVVRNEFEIGENNPQAILEERIYSTAFLWHNYGNTTIGARSDIEQVPIERLQAFYRTWYRPENAILVVAGKFEREKTLNLIAEKFGPLENPETPLPPVYTIEPAQDGERSVTLRRVGEVQVAAAAYHIPAGSHADYPALAVLAEILADSPSGRLHKKLVETGMATSVDGRADRFKDPALFYLSAEVPKDKDVMAVQAELIDTAENFISNRPTDEDVSRAVNSLQRRWQSTMRNTSWAAINLSEWASMGDWRLMFLHRDRLAKVTTDDVVRVADTYLGRNNRTTGLFLPTQEAQRVEIAEVTPESLEETLSSYEGGEAMAMGEDFDPSPESIESRLERMTFSNGMQVAFLPKKTRGETVHLQMNLHFGSEASLRGKAQVGRFTADMLDRGTTSRTRQEIRDEADRLQANIRVGGGATGVNAHIEVSRGNLVEAVRLVGDMLRNPSFDAEEFRQIKDERLVELEQSKTEPRSRVFQALSRHLYPYERDDVRYTPTPDEAIEMVGDVGAENLRQFYDEFYGASSAELAVVGDFDRAEIEPVLSELFGDWVSKAPYERLVTEYEKRPAIVERMQIPDKESAVLGAGLRMHMNDEDPGYPAAELGSFMIGGGFLNSRLATRIRQQEGLSYAVGARFRAPSVGDDARFNGFAMYAPQNDARLLDAFQDEMRKAVEVPFTEQEVAEAKSGWLQRQQVSRGNDSELSRDITNLMHDGRTFAWPAELEAKISEVTVGDISTVLKTHLVPGDISIVRAGDFEKVESEGSAGTESSSVQ